MRFDGILTGRGVYQIDGQTYPWVELADANSGDRVRATLAEDADVSAFDAIPLFVQPVRAEVGLRTDNSGKIKVRAFSVAKAA